MLKGLPNTVAKPLQVMFPSASSEALDLITACLRFDPSKRPSVETLLEHPYVAQFHKPETEPAGSRLVKIAVEDSIK